MDSEKRLVFFKERIKSRLEEIKGDITELRYKLLVTLVDTCDNFEELREMAELDMQLDMFEYTRNEINPKLAKLNMGIDELRESKDSAIRLDNTTEKPNFELNIRDNGPVDTYSAEEMLEDLDDPEIDAAMAAILLNRVLTEPMEETYRDDMLDGINETKPSIEDIDKISDEELEELGDIGESAESDDEGDEFELADDEFDIADDEDEDDTDEGDKAEVKSSEAGLFDDFADINTDVTVAKEVRDENDELDMFADDGLFADEDEDDESDGENEDEQDIFNISDDELEDEIDDDESEDELDEDEDFDDSGLFADDEDEEDDEDSDEDELDDSDLFSDYTDEDESEDEDEEETDIDLLEDVDLSDLIDDDDEEDDTFDNNKGKDKASFDGLENTGDMFDSLSDDDLAEEIGEDEDSDEDSDEDDSDEDDNLDDDLLGDFLGDEDNEDTEEDEEAEDDPFGDIAGLEDFADDEDGIQIEDDEEDFFNKPSSKSAVTKQGENKHQQDSKQTTPRKIETKTVFTDGTNRGQKTQDMFTSITKIGSLFGRMGAQAATQTKKAVQNTKSKAATSNFFKLPINIEEDDAIEGF